MTYQTMELMKDLQSTEITVPLFRRNLHKSAGESSTSIQFRHSVRRYHNFRFWQIWSAEHGNRYPLWGLGLGKENP